MHTRFFRRTYRRSGRRIRTVRFAASLLIFLFLLACLERRLPQLPDAVWETALQRYAQARIAKTVNGCMAEQPVLYDGSLMMLDTYTLSALQADLTAELQNALSGRAKVRIPVGSLTGVAILEGRGPKLPLWLSAESAVQVVFESRLQSAGINRTQYAVVMRITAQVCSVSARFPGAVTAEAVFPVCESVLEGDIPQYGAVLR